MKDGFLKVCAATPQIRVADPIYNTDQIMEIISQCEEKQVKLVVFPELCITGYTCGDLFFQDVLVTVAKKQLDRIRECTEGKDVLTVVGLPVEKDGKLYNAAAVLHDGSILGLVPKVNIPNYSEFYEARHFQSGGIGDNLWQGVPFGSRILFQCDNMEDFVLGIEICEDLWVPIPPSSSHAMAGATVIANLSASDEMTGKDAYRRELVRGQSARLVCGYVYADAGEGESTTDMVFSGHNMIGENGLMLEEAERFANECIISELDLNKLKNERRRMNTFTIRDREKEGYTTVSFEFRRCPNTELTRKYEPLPFVPSDEKDRSGRCSDILKLQAMGLKKRLLHTSSRSAVIGLSGGLDSTLALLVCGQAFQMAAMDKKNILAVTMPCFGTTDRTLQNAKTLAECFGVTFQEIPIHKTVLSHFEDIGQSADHHDITFENAQARMRTQVLMNLANQKNGLVIGTGDLSELALGWATYNGDHMSMYGVNASVPKTLVRHLVRYYSDTADNAKLSRVLTDILDTPVSPELLPPEDGKIQQITEDIVGPYELHDFFLYYVLRFGFLPSKLYRIAVRTFSDTYDERTIYKWLTVFYRRFFSQQFKRSCLPDGPKVGSAAVSPRGDLRMPSDACVRIWMEDLEKLEVL